MYIIYSHSDVIEYELLENGETVTKGGIGRALAEGVLFGGVGAVVGGGACEKIGSMTKEKFTMIKENDTLYKALDFINR